MGKFLTKDLMINTMSGSGNGSAGLFIDTPPTPATPITPVAAVAAFSPQLKEVDRLLSTDKVDVGRLGNLAQSIGEAAIGARAVALCTQDMPTCANDPFGHVSRLAHSFRDLVRRSDLSAMLEAVGEAEKGLAKAEKTIQGKLIPELRERLG